MSTQPSPVQSRDATDLLAAAGLQAPNLAPAWAEFYATLPRSIRLLVLGQGTASELAARSASDWQLQVLPDTLPLPLPTAGTDAAAVQPGIALPQARALLAELHRVLAPGADAQLLWHHAAAPLLFAARWAMVEADAVLRLVRIHRRLERLVTLDAQAAPAATQRASDELRGGIQALKRSFADAQQQGGGRVLGLTLESIQRLLVARTTMRPVAAGLEVDRAEAELRVLARRAGELVSLGMGSEQATTLAQHAAELGFTRIDCLPLQQAGAAPQAWQLLLHRP